ncbi:proline-, glutamic acid- and leucine-rich protein 1-like isoform X2 [Chironomus tepperi]|uniref:proline-, glutamic acid- and leucine-rich protein 1-like isoform X2 n=1 Tax=Chironomus tepperi TaxID=113505 RepID=UPI00391F490D
MDKETNTASKDAESSKNQPDFSVLFMKMLEDKKQDNSKDVREARIKNINRYLKSTQNYRTLGLISLADFLELHTVVSAAFTTEKECQELEWIELMLRFIDNKSEEADKCFPILTKLMIITSQHPDMHKIIQAKYVSKIIESITTNPISIPSLQCLAVCMKEYNGPSGIFKNKIYDYCVASVDIMDPVINNLSGKCLHLRQQTRGGSVGGAAYKKNWTEYHEKLLNTMEEMFINLLQTGESINSGKSERLKLPEGAEGKKNMPLMYSHQERFMRFQNICIFLNVSLVQPFPVAKSILLNWIVSFIDKSTTTNQAQINKKDGDRILPFILHIEVQKCLLGVLSATMKAVGRNIIIHSKDICDVFWKSLKSTNVPYDEFKISEISSLRSTIYDVITEFMKISPNNNFINKNMENFVKEAFLDITPIQSEILLTLPGASSESNKKKKKNPEVKKTLSGKTFDNCIKIHQQLCIKSLNFFNSLLISNGAGMKPVLFKILTDKVLIVTYKFLSRDLTQQDLYHSSDCRLGILELIYNILINPAIRNATPSSFMVELLKKFKDTDKSEKLRNKSNELIRTVEAILHNRKDPIHFPSDLKDFRDSWLFNEKIVKSFNEVNTERKGHIFEVDSIDETEDVSFFQNIISRKNSDSSVLMDVDQGEKVDDNQTEASNGTSNGKEQTPEPESLEESNSNGKDEEESSPQTEEKEVSSPKIVEKEKSIKKSPVTVKRPSDSPKVEEIPAKIAKESAKEPEKVVVEEKLNGEEEDIVNSYLADFCNE